MRSREPTNPGFKVADIAPEEPPAQAQPPTVGTLLYQWRYVLAFLGGIGTVGPGATMLYNVVNWPWVSKADFDTFKKENDESFAELKKNVAAITPANIAAELDKLAEEKAAKKRGRR